MNTGPLFWQQTIQPGSKEQLVFEMDSTLGVNSVSLLNVTDPEDKTICRLWAYVYQSEEVIPDSSDEESNKDSKTESKTEEKKEEETKKSEDEPKVHKFLFASLLPNLRETNELNYYFSPFDIVELENTSKYPIQVTGTYTFLENEDYDEEEDEEEQEKEGEDESLNVNELQKKVMDFMKEKGHQQ